jgi:class 3 adenylate cyclase
LEFRILGPVEALDREGRALQLPRGRPRALLALLLVHATEAVPVDRVIEELWGDQLPENPHNAAQGVASRLRRAIGTEVVLSEAGGYRLRLEPGERDSDRFEELAARGRGELARGDAAGAAETLRRALGLWRGPALADVRFERFAQSEVARLEELRLACSEARIDADLALGRHAEVVPELEKLVGERPLSERLRGQLMLALYRSGRQAEALAAYREARRTLVEELGIEPSPDLRELEQSILRQEAGPPPALPESAPTPARALRRRVTCLVSNLAGSAALGELLDPEVLRPLLIRCHEAMRLACEKYGGAVHDSIGDGIVAVFGTPVSHEDDALRAVLAADEMRVRLAELNAKLEPAFRVELASRTGLNTGEVLTPGGENGDTLVLGSAGSIAARLEQVAAPGEILLGDATRALLGDTVRVELRPTAVSDASAPVRAYRFLEVVPAASQVGPRPETPFFGREPELRLLRDAFDRSVTESACHLVTVLGEPGIGKSTLVRELQPLLGSEATFLVGRCPAYGEGITYWPVREMVLQAAGSGTIDELVHGLEDGPAVARGVATALGLEEGVAGEEALWTFRRLFTEIARARPLVLVFEDVHYGQTALVDLVDHLASWIRDAPVLLLCLARPELLDTHPEWAGGQRNAASLTLGPLSAEESRELLVALAGKTLEEAGLARIAATAGGNPFFLEQLLAHVGERGTTPADLGLPPALQALLAARLDLLGPRERSLLEHGAVEGEVFHLGSVLALSEDLSRSDAEGVLQELLRRDLLRPEKSALVGEDAVRFRHELIRDAAYESLPKADRAHLHERHARWLENLGAAVPEPDARIGFHLERACRLAREVGSDGDEEHDLAVRAGRRLAEAARQAHRRGDLSGEIGFLERAVELLGPGEAAAAELLPALGSALTEAGTFDQAADVAGRAVELGDRLGLPLVRWRGMIEGERLRLYRHPESVDVDATIAVAEAGTAALRELGDDLGLSRASYLMCDLAWTTGHTEASFEHAERAVEYARRAGIGFEVAAALNFIAALVEGPTPVSEAVVRCVALEREVAGHRAAELTLLGCRAALAAMDRRVGEARESMARSRAGLEELGLHEASAWMALMDAQAEMLAGSPATAASAARDTERITRAIGDRWFLSAALVDYAHALLAQDHIGDAVAAVEAIETVPAPSDMEWLIKRHTARARLAACQGEAEHGLSEARQAVELADRTDLIVFRAHAHHVLADLLLSAGQPQEAEEAAERSLELCESKGNAAAAWQVRRFLETLRGERRA